MSGLVLTPQMGDVLARQIAETGVLSGADRHWLSLEWQRLAASEPRPLSQLADSGPHLDRILDPGGPCLREAEYERAFLGVQSLQTAVAEDEAAHRPLPIMQGALHLLHEGHQEGDSRYRKEQLLHLPADSRQQRSRSSSQGNSAPIHPLDYAVDQLGWEGWLHYRTLLMRQRQEFSLQVLLAALQLVHAMCKAAPLCTPASNKCMAAAPKGKVAEWALWCVGSLPA